MKYLFTIFLTLTCISTAHAQWTATSTGGAFDDNPLNIALTAKGNYGFGLRCKADESELVFITPETLDDAKAVEFMNAAGPKLRVRVDRGQITDLDGVIHNTDGKLTIISNVDGALMKQVRDAKSSISAAISVLGKNFHESAFGTTGSKAAVAKIMKACKIE